MDTITLNSDLCCDALVIPGKVVDRMLDEANEAQLKIYLYLLKMGSAADVSVASIADYFNYTEQDVTRALRFWNGKGKSARSNSNSGNTDNTIRTAGTQGDNVVAFSVRPSYTKEQLSEFATMPDVAQLLFVAEQYLARPLKPDDISSMLYMYSEIGFSTELIEFLMEYCISNNKKSVRSMEGVALEWKEAGVNTLADAKKFTGQVPDEMNEVIACFGLPANHQPIDAEIAYVRKWTASFGYGMDVIREALQRTILSIQKPSFKYANSILKGWHDAGVKNIADILNEDEKFRQKKVADAASGNNAGNVRRSVARQESKKGKFSNFAERDYDYDSLMKDILSN